jgi:hypothetical protein
MLADVARLNASSGEQLRRLHFGPTQSERRMARLTLQRLTDNRILARLDRRIGGTRSGSDGFVYCLDVAGQRLSYSDRRRFRPPWTPVPSHLDHALAVSQLYVDMTTLDHSEVRLHEFVSEPESWRQYFGPGGARQVLKPDAFAVTTDGEYDDYWLIEVDRATESSTRIIEKLREYIRYFESGREQSRLGVFPRIVWIVQSLKRQEQLTDAISSLPAEYWHIFVVTRDFVALVQAPINQSHVKEVKS